MSKFIGSVPMTTRFKLSEGFLSEYKDKKPEWGPMGEFVFYRTYSRKKEDGSNETWWETVKRVVEGTFSIQREHCQSLKLPWKNDKAQRSAQKMYNKIFNFKFLPPGRGLWMMGTDFIFERGGMALNNCFEYNTEIITIEGIKKIGDCVGTEQIILTSNSKWMSAPIKYFGKQKLWKLVLSRQGMEKIIYTTGDHIWFVKDRRQEYRQKEFSEFKTKDLRPRIHRLQYMFASSPHKTKTVISRLGISHGIVFGDGTLIPGEKNSNLIRLCGEKNIELKKYFGFTNIDKKIGKEDLIVRNLPNFFKEKPSIHETKSYLYGWLTGYFAADGSVNKNGQIKLVSYNYDNILFIKDICSVIGIGAYGIRKEQRLSNLTEKYHNCYSITFMGDSLTKEFFLLKEHKNNFIKNNVSKNIERTWIIESVGETERVDDVYCVVVEETHKFTLADNILTSNCGFVSTEDIEYKGTMPFCFMMDALMNGVGVGFDTKGAGKIKLKHPGSGTIAFTIPDSREGWVESIQILLDSYFFGKSRPVFDYSLIRPAGSPIKGFGGIASGPEPLELLHKRITFYVEEKAALGQILSSVNIVDIMNMIGTCVIAGNVRRSAEIAIGDVDDLDFVTMKDPKIHAIELTEWRWASNNSVFVKKGQKNYKNLIDSVVKNGEPGFVWLDNIQQFGRLKDVNGNGKKDLLARGVNPSLRKGTKVLTKNGIYNIEDLENKEILVRNLNGEWKKAKCFLSGRNKLLYKIELNNGYLLYATKEHKWPINKGGELIKKESCELRKGDLLFLSKDKNLDIENDMEYTREDGFMIGWLYGDGTICKRKDNGKFQYSFHFCKDKKDLSENILKCINKIKLTESNVIKRKGRDEWTICISSLEFNKYLKEKFGVSYKKDGLPKMIWKSSDEFIKGFIDGYFSSDGCVSKKNICVTSKDKKLINDLRVLLSFYGIHCDMNGRILKNIKFPNKKIYNRTYKIYRLRMSPNNSIKFRKTIEYLSNHKKNHKMGLIEVNNKFHKNNIDFIRIKKISLTGIKEDVWDISVFDESHTFAIEGCITGNCGEQALESYELCNLVESFPSRHSNYEEYEETLKSAYLYAKTVTLIETAWPETNQVTLKNRRIGTSQSGIIDAFVRHGRREMLKWCDKGYDYLKKLDQIYSDWLCVPKSIKITSVKPSGTVSLLPGVSPGIHFPHAKYYIRRIRIADTSPLLPILENAGYNIEIDKISYKTKIVSFPIEEKYYERSKFDVSVWEQVKNAIDYQTYWCDNNVSVTVTFKSSEKDDLVRILEAYDDQLKAISFLPLEDHGYKQAPLERISEEDYHGRVLNITELNFRELSLSPIGEKFCTNECCTI